MWSKHPFPFVNWKYKLFYLLTLLLLTEIICLPHWNILEYGIKPVPFLWLCCVKHHCYISTLIAILLIKTAVFQGIVSLTSKLWEMTAPASQTEVKNILPRAPGMSPWEMVLPTMPARNHKKQLPRAERFLSLPEQVAIKHSSLSPGMCYGVYRGSALFLNAEISGGKMPCLCSAILTWLYYFSWWIWLSKCKLLGFS